jgi:hypothetical protein
MASYTREEMQSVVTFIRAVFGHELGHTAARLGGVSTSKGATGCV